MTKKEKQAKVAKVMREFKAGTLKGSDKKPVKNRKQAIAIALSEVGMSREGKSDEYWDNYFMTLIGEEEEEKEGEEEGEEEEMMDESAGEARCRGYLAALAKDKRKKR
jgi:hypothetical protein